MQFDWFLRMIYHRTDAKMTSPLTKCSFFLSQKQIDCTLTCVLTIKGIRRRQNFVRTSVTDSAASDVPLRCFNQILTASVMDYWTHALQNGIYLYNRVAKTQLKMNQWGYNYYVLIDWVGGQVGKTDQTQRGPYDREPNIFPSGPTKLSS